MSGLKWLIYCRRISPLIIPRQTFTDRRGLAHSLCNNCKEQLKVIHKFNRIANYYFSTFIVLNAQQLPNVKTSDGKIYRKWTYNFQRSIQLSQFISSSSVINIFFFSYDKRGQLSRNPKSWSDKIIENRTYFLPLTEPSTLSIDKINEADEGEYRCRIDYLKSPTKNLRVRLNVIGKCNFDELVKTFFKPNINLIT